MLVANRPDVNVVGLVPDATLLSARIVKSATVCEGKVLSDGLIKALGWLRRHGAQVVNVSATAGRSRAPSSNPCGRCSSRERWSSPPSATATTLTYPAVQPGVLGVGALAPGIDQEGLVEIDARSAGRSGGAGRGHQGHRLDRRLEEHSVPS